MSARRPISLLLVLLAMGSLVTAASGSPAASPPPGAPDLAAMALATTDLPAGTRIESQRYTRDPDFGASYTREFAVRGGRLGRSRLLYLYESLDVERTPADARRTFGLFAALFRGKQGAQLLEEAIASGAGSTRLAVSVGKIRRPAIGHGARRQPPFRRRYSSRTIRTPSSSRASSRYPRRS